MSLYSLVFQTNGSGRVLCEALLPGVNVGRYRDAWIEKGDDGKPVLAVYTRNGGGNRDCWKDADNESCDCTGCIATIHLPAHPLYVNDVDDEFDSTYATFYFRVPDAFIEEAASIAVDPVNMSEVWLQAIEALKA